MYLAGNCRLRIGRRHFAMIEGRPPERRPREGRGIGAPGAQVLFAVLARPDLLNAAVRTLAEVAGVAPATAADRVAQLRSEGLVHEADSERRLAEPRDTVVHLQEPGFGVPKRLGALREHLTLILMHAPGPIAFEGAHPHTVNPLPVYTELLFTGDKRAREAAQEIRKKFLGHLP